MRDRRTPSAMRMLARGAMKRCPFCGCGHLFRRWFTLPPRCPRCRVRFEQTEGAFLGSMALNYAFAGMVFFAFLAVWLVIALPDVAAIPLVAASLGVITVAVLISYPFAKTVWCAIELLLRDPRDMDRN